MINKTFSDRKIRLFSLIETARVRSSILAKAKLCRMLKKRALFLANDSIAFC